MTQDEIIEMAKQSGMEVWKGGHRYMDDFDIYKFAKLVALHEREACALVCESHWEKEGSASWCARAIRARGDHD